MKGIVLALCLLTAGCAHLTNRFQVVVMGPDGTIHRLDPQSRDDADKKALVINMSSQGQATAWVQHKQGSAAQTAPVSLPKMKTTDQE